MKKILIMLLSLFATLTVSAQYWQQVKSEADELKGTQASSYHAIKVPDKCVITLDDNNNDLFIFSSQGVFDYERDDYGGHHVKALFGMYDENDKLVSKKTISMFVSPESPSNALCKSSPDLSLVASWIRSFKGSVRIVIPRYGNIDFDVKLPTMQSQKVPNSGQVKPKATPNRSNKKTVRKK